MSSAKKQTTNQTSVFIRKQRSLCILLHPQARIFRCVKFSKLIPTAKPMGKEVFTSRKSLVKLPKFQHNELDLLPVKYHKIKRHLLPWPSLPEYSLSIQWLPSKCKTSPLPRVWFDMERSLRIFKFPATVIIGKLESPSWIKRPLM